MLELKFSCSPKPIVTFEKLWRLRKAQESAYGRTARNSTKDFHGKLQFFILHTWAQPLSQCPGKGYHPFTLGLGKPCEQSKSSSGRDSIENRVVYVFGKSKQARAMGFPLVAQGVFRHWGESVGSGPMGGSAPCILDSYLALTGVPTQKSGGGKHLHCDDSQKWTALCVPWALGFLYCFFCPTQGVPQPSTEHTTLPTQVCLWWVPDLRRRPTGSPSKEGAADCITEE